MKTEIYYKFRDKVDQIVEKHGAYTLNEKINSISPTIPKVIDVTYKFVNGGTFKAQYKESLNSIGFESRMNFSQSIKPQSEQFKKIQKEFTDLRKATIKQYK